MNTLRFIWKDIFEMFEELTDKQKLVFFEYLQKNYKDFIEYTSLPGPNGPRRVFNHFYPRPAKAAGTYKGLKKSGDK